MQQGVFIEWDLESTPLEVKTNSVLGSGNQVYVGFFNANNKYAGRVQLNFNSTLQYQLHICTESWATLPVTPPSAAEKVWRVTLTKTTGVRVVIHCNEVEVLNKLFSSTTCSTKITYWSTYWKRDVTKIKFFYDSASDYYRAGD